MATVISTYSGLMATVISTFSLYQWLDGYGYCDIYVFIISYLRGLMAVLDGYCYIYVFYVFIISMA